MKYFDRGLGFHLKKFLSLILSIGMITLPMPMNSSAEDITVQDQLPTLSEGQTARPPYGKITKIIINYSFGNNIDMDIPAGIKDFEVEVWAQLEDGSFIGGRELAKVCKGIYWEIMNPIAADVIGTPIKTGPATVRVPVSAGSGHAWVSALCNNPDAVKGGYKSGNASGRRYLRGEGLGLPSTSRFESTQNRLTPVKSSISTKEVLIWVGIGLGIAGSAAVAAGVALGGSSDSGSSHVDVTCDQIIVAPYGDCASMRRFSCSDNTVYYISSDGYRTRACNSTDLSCEQDLDNHCNKKK
jgi:hypothetical protein